MLIYQIRQRVFRLLKGEDLVLPADTKLTFYLKPNQPFGMEAGGGRTAIHGVAASSKFNANTGEHTVESETPLKPLDVTIEEPTRMVEFQGNILTISQHFKTKEELSSTIESIYHFFPLLLNIPFADPPIIERIEGQVGANSFRWELANWSMNFLTTTQERQENAAADAWEQLGLLSRANSRRFNAALHYFHVACRLSRQNNTPGEFLPEVLLNYAKILEVLFPPSGDGLTRDSARKGLKELNFTDDEIEGNFIPAMAMRNELDVSHVELGLFTMEQLKVLHSYAENAEYKFRTMLERIIKGIIDGTFKVPDYKLGSPRREALLVIERLKKYMPDHMKTK